MKQRFSSLDVKVIANELASSLTTLRVSNIYDLSSRIFLFKFAKPGKREQLLVDSGFRCHLTSFSRTAASAPSAFVSRLRKYLKSRRVTAVSQIGTDRVIEITFSDGQYRLFLEFFAAGNIIVTDADLSVLALQRQVSEGQEDVDVKLGGKYTLEAKQNFHGIPPITEERVKTVLEKAVQRAKLAQEVGGKKAKRAKGADDLRKALSDGFPELPYHLLEHVFIETGTDSTQKADAVLSSPEVLQSAIKALQRALEIFNALDAGHSKGYIIAKTKAAPSAEAPTQTQTQPAQEQEVSRDSLLYDDFHPFRPAQFENKPGLHILEFDGFNRTVDEFYSSIESQKLESRLTEREEAAKRKLEATRTEHEKRLAGLQQVQDLHVRKAQAIEANTHRVEEACAAVNGLIAQGMDWVDIGKLIENEQKRGNVVAQMVKLPLKLEENTVTLLLDEPSFDEGDESDEEDMTDDEAESDEEPATTNKPTAGERRLAIDIDLALSPWANARSYYENKKLAAGKEKRTMEASAKALKSAEHKIEADLKKGLKTEKAVLRPARKQFWFEKFLYFISSDGYLVIGGKDAQQNELLYRRYLKKGDIYVHADLQGASSVIVKNNPKTPDAPIPPSTLSQAGALTVCTSSAWDSKALMGAWWVNADQVSKTAPTGEYLTTGGFIIRGHKNLLPPSQLLLGFGVMWLISDESRANHGKHRLERTESMLSGEAEALANDARGLSIDEDDAGSEVERDGQHEQAIPDVEEAADEAAEEENEDDRGVDQDEAHKGDAEVDDEDQNHDSSAPSEVEDERSNPLQMQGTSAGKDTTNDEPDVQISADRDAEEAEDDEDDDEHQDTQDTPQEATPSTRPSTPASSSHATAAARPKPAHLARGKRSKAKRAAKKYADQDEEDRALAMQLLGSTRAQEQRKEAEADKAAREAKAQADRERRKAQHAKAADRERARRERLEKAGDAGAEAAALDEEDELSREQLEQERQELLAIDRLVPVPEPGDELLAAIPVVAPWTALTRQKYKIKLQPGSVKKGKAVKEILGLWTSLGSRGPKVVDESNRERERVWRREVELLKEWRVEEIVGAVPVKGCRIVQGGGLLGGSLGGSGGGGKGKGSGGGKGKGGGRRGR
ncbi:tRNA threonylcarbamoyladenosine biosynthesis protein [Cladophialophora yegresii CBS 114405]|uniref:Ribosome quality control complex subunit 2 n=1 Tax=Cladophialophora yegresii CBS 114405 TaxID=1182544 RepID=W9VFP2_9EURO|nr:tRNA threonylcarbamoyladenosine biosynthesis protein [Cladophialophora yegresii CBS 114405]EXJ54308.1 tRNA threonylcarbamoyladenosine biosynthesis protein [Cladophialophora yegresii CBS 114405]